MLLLEQSSVPTSDTNFGFHPMLSFVLSSVDGYIRDLLQA
jgi:hypothetical protein